jgi:hypothetical protein
MPNIMYKRGAYVFLPAFINVKRQVKAGKTEKDTINPSDDGYQATG